MQWSDTSFTSDKVSDFQGTSGALTTPASEDAASSAWSVRKLDLQQAYDRYVEATSPAARLEAGADLQATLQDQLNAEKAFEKFLNIIYPVGDARQAAAREGVELPENRDCEMAAR